jgi:hypothetical protein
MKTVITLHGKPVQVELSDAAETELRKRTTPLYAEAQLIFGCMIAKRVWFRDEAVEHAVFVAPNFRVWFRPVRYAKSCSFDDIDSGAEASDYPMVADLKRFVPDALTVNYRAGKWIGDFTFSLDLLRARRSDP